MLRLLFAPLRTRFFNWLSAAGTAWDTNRAWAPKGGTGFGVRLIAELATMAPWTSTSPTTTS